MESDQDEQSASSLSSLQHVRGPEAQPQQLPFPRPLRTNVRVKVQASTFCHKNGYRERGIKIETFQEEVCTQTKQWSKSKTVSFPPQTTSHSRGALASHALEASHVTLPVVVQAIASKQREKTL